MTLMPARGASIVTVRAATAATWFISRSAPASAAALVLNGELFTGAHGMAGEFGHIMLTTGSNAPQYAAGKPGILEALASGPAIARRAAEVLTARKSAVPDSLTAKLVFDAARSGADWAVQVRDEAIGHLARGVAAAICAYDPERVVIGGGVSRAGDTLFVPSCARKSNACCRVILKAKLKLCRRRWATPRRCGTRGGIGTGDFLKAKR